MPIEKTSFTNDGSFHETFLLFSSAGDARAIKSFIDVARRSAPERAKTDTIPLVQQARRLPVNVAL